ncbi:TetR/AcrR family transcriptional regulator [Trinickia caryophylli]|uniref:Transcriptional regulator, TetR family n=1 Tax=Trinickia caryophylli TaxID=28094 RepID=A0A1X7EP45_TRICW|nr:TetR family transcriptional regulator [Trinickia caryophylli]PMS10239.1 TetR/AcrR family transcriptional regulator [Trinickia caryophylli]TRX18709.1 TetR/AcrR family transcriptional regulator [Trinickia caryophylli]WQE10493.1 TetR/AcrR family transcriptional regulator [Trinickia caryophylli]SMF37579.1 transcriptional regulator, TetR family [Trinickia caryophylli]
MTRAAKKKVVGATGVREAAAQETRDKILRAATKVFARYGYDGGSVEKISGLAKSYDRMIYYYYGSKEGLFVAVLEDAYRRMDEAESKVAPDPSVPVEALKTLIRFKLDYYWRNPDFMTLLNTENLHKGRHVSTLERKGEYSSHALQIIARILESGAEQGLFRKDLDPRHVFLLIASAAYFYTSNRYTLSVFLGEELGAPEAVREWEAFVIDSVLRVVRADTPSGS